MKPLPQDMNTALMLDGNAVGGLLNEIFSMEMTTSLAQCNHCGTHGELGSLQAFTNSMGIVLRCPVCGEVVLRFVQFSQAIYLDLRGATYLRLDIATG